MAIDPVCAMHITEQSAAGSADFALVALGLAGMPVAASPAAVGLAFALAAASMGGLYAALPNGPFLAAAAALAVGTLIAARA